MRKLVVNIALLAAGLTASFSDIWGADVHSVLGIAFGFVVVAHLASHRRWIRAVRQRRRRHPERRLAAYNATFAAVLATCLISGFPVWFGADIDPFGSLHTVTGIAFIVMIGGHLVLNRHRIRTFLRRAR